ncbi:MAG: hypothetical protein ACLP62_14045 [Acidimicrobiales bacterium]
MLGLAWFGLAPASGAAFPRHHHPPRPPHGPSAVIDLQVTTTYGPVLVLTHQGTRFPIYLISSDHPPKFGCTTTVEVTFNGTFPCTGPPTFSATSTGPTSSEWPAVTTTGPPVAGPGVQRALLGVVYRPGVGLQVTYAGHPLYLFSPPTTFFGEGFLETVLPLPPWHGLWDLVSSTTGNPATGQGVLEPGTLPSGASVLSAEEYPQLGIPGGVHATVYDFCNGPTGPPWPSFPKSNPSSPGTCPTLPSLGPPWSHGPFGTPRLPGPGYGPATTNWIPVLTQGPPTGIGGVPDASLGTVHTFEGTQVTYDGRPLYLYASEMAQFVTGQPGTAGTVGNGVGVPGPGGTAHVIALP